MGILTLLGAGPGAAGAAPAAFTVTYRDIDASATDATSYTFSGMDIGPASADRQVILIVWTQSGSALAVSTTINGNATNAIVSVGAGDARGLSAYSLGVPTGTTADVVVNGDGVTNFLRCGCAVITITGTTQTAYEERNGANPTQAASATSVTTSAAVTAPSGGVAIAASWLGSATFATSWSQTSGSGTELLPAQVIAETVSGSIYSTTDTASQQFTASGTTANWRALAFTWGP